MKYTISTVLFVVMTPFVHPCLANTHHCQPRVPISDEFLALGPIQEVDGLIWSSVGPELLNQRLAITFCEQLGGEARLPSLSDYLDWLGAQEGQHSLVRESEEEKSEGFGSGGLYRLWYWTSTLHHEHEFRAYYFDSNEGKIKETFRLFSRAVRCVVDCL